MPVSHLPCGYVDGGIREYSTKRRAPAMGWWKHRRYSHRQVNKRYGLFTSAIYVLDLAGGFHLTATQRLLGTLAVR